MNEMMSKTENIISEVLLDCMMLPFRVCLIDNACGSPISSGVTSHGPYDDIVERTGECGRSFCEENGMRGRILFLLSRVSFVVQTETDDLARAEHRMIQVGFIERFEMLPAVLGGIVNEVLHLG